MGGSHDNVSHDATTIAGGAGRKMELYIMRSLFLLTQLWVAIVTASEEGCGVESSVVVSSIKAIKELDSTSTIDVCAELKAGVEYIDYSETLVTSHTVQIVGHNSTIRCNESIALPVSDYYNFPLIFTNLMSVKIRNVTFENCVRALQLQQVKVVELINCVFR